MFLLIIFRYTQLIILKFPTRNHKRFTVTRNETRQYNLKDSNHILDFINTVYVI